MFVEIGVVYFLVVEQFFVVVVYVDFFGDYYVGVVGEFQCMVGVLFDEEDGYVVFGQFVQGLEDLFDYDWCQVQGGFVE